MARGWSGSTWRCRIVGGFLAVLLALGPGLPGYADHEPGHTGPESGLLAQATQQTFTAPTFQSPLILPTDVSSWGGEQGRSKGLKNVEGPPDLAAWLFHGQAPRLERDSRYSFTGVWTYFGEVDQLASTLQGKIPALAKVTAELQTPCGQAPQSMPPVPDLPSPEKVGKAPPIETGVGHVWKACDLPPGAKQDAGAIAAAHSGRLVFSRNCQAFLSGTGEHGTRMVVGTAGTTAIAKSAHVLIVKVGRAYIHNGSESDLEVESGRMSIMLPPGASGIVDTASNGLTQYASLVDSPRRQTRVVDLCNPSFELAKVDAGGIVTVAHEDAVVEDLIALHGIGETVDKVTRKEGYLLVIGRFSLGDAIAKDSVLQSPLFQSDANLKNQKAALVAASQAAGPARAPLTGGVIAHNQETTQETPVGDKSGAAFMPTRGARYGTISANELMIADGAVLVKGSESPVIVSAEVNRKKIMTQIKSGAVVMVSALDGRLTVLNLTDSGSDACVIYLPGEDGTRTKSVAVGTGQVAELYINDGLEPASTILSYNVIEKKSLPGKVGLLLAKYDYLAAMKRFNLSFALPSQDLNRVLKTMAATAYLMYGRSGR